MIRADGWIDTYRRLHPHGGSSADQDIGASHATTSYRTDYVFEFNRSGVQLPVHSVTMFMNAPRLSTLEPSGWLWPSDHWGVLASVG